VASDKNKWVSSPGREGHFLPGTSYIKVYGEAWPNRVYFSAKAVPRKGYIFLIYGGLGKGMFSRRWSVHVKGYVFQPVIFLKKVIYNIFKAT
jgi:hypothetical protein